MLCYAMPWAQGGETESGGDGEMRMRGALTLTRAPTAIEARAQSYENAEHSIAYSMIAMLCYAMLREGGGGWGALRLDEVPAAPDDSARYGSSRQS